MIIQSKKVFVSGVFIPAEVEVWNGKIRRVMPYGAVRADSDLGDLMVLPGLIDVHTHGAFGFSTESADPEGLRMWASKLPEEGVTSFLPTTITNETEKTKAALSNVANVMKEDRLGAEILGAHLEGPMLDKKYRGAHNENFLKTPSADLFQELNEAAGNNIRYLTLACEHDEDYSLTKYASQNGVRVALGHSGADLTGAMLAIANGASSFTHTFNGMSGFHHRDAGVAAAVMRCHTYAEIIGDGNHVIFDVINVLFKAHPEMILISDSLMMKGMPPGVYDKLNGQSMTVDENGSAYITGTKTLSGSSLFINKGLRNLVKEALVPVEAAVLAATLNPARMLGIENRKGQIKSGCDADLCILDGDFSVIKTICRGKEAYNC